MSYNSSKSRAVFPRTLFIFINIFLIFDIIKKVFPASVNRITLKLIKSGNAGKIIKDSYLQNINYTVTIGQIVYDKTNFTKSVTPNGQDITIKWENDLPKCCEGMFNVGEPKIIEEIKSFSFTDNSKISTTKNMFLGQTNLKKIYLNNLKTNNVEDMSGMFQECTSLEQIYYLNDLNFANINNMEKMFYKATSMKSLTFPTVDANTLNMKLMFGYCSNLETIDLSKITINNQITFSQNIFELHLQIPVTKSLLLKLQQTEINLLILHLRLN